MRKTHFYVPPTGFTGCGLSIRRRWTIFLATSTCAECVAAARAHRRSAERCLRIAIRALDMTPDQKSALADRLVERVLREMQRPEDFRRLAPE